MTALRLPADYESARAIGPWLQESLDALESSQRDRVGEIELAVHEVAINIVDHACASTTDAEHYTIDISNGDRPGELIVRLRDTGAAFEAAPAPDLDNPQVGGYGLFIAEQLTSRLSYERVDGTNIWTLVFDPRPTFPPSPQETP